MSPTFTDLKEKKLIGMCIQMSMSENKTTELWKQFMPRRKEISDLVDDNLYSIQIYTENYTLENFNDHTIFEMWAAVEVSVHGDLSEGMESLVLPGGKYAVFIHKGIASAFGKTAEYIFRDWLPQSGYRLDHRPHFEIMGKKYLGPENPNSEEEVFIPVIRK